MASYCIGTGKRIDETRRFAREQPVVWQRLLEKLQVATIDFLRTMRDHGGQMYQLFDSWAGELNEAEYREWALPHHQAIFAGATGVPRVIFVKESPRVDWLFEAGADIISLGRRQNLGELRKRYPDQLFQGNVDEELLRDGTPEQVEAATRVCLEEGGGHRHILT